MKSAVKDLRHYLSRPIIPFCFGVPLLLPATLLTVVAFLQHHISPLLQVLGILFLSLSLLSITCGMVLGFRDVCRKRTRVSKRPVTRGFQKVARKSPRGKKTPNGNSVTPESLSTPNSQNSSRRSSCSVGSAASHLIITNEMIRLVPNKGRKGKSHHRFSLSRTTRKPGKPGKPGRMPALQEEDHTSHAGENGDVRRNSLRSSKTERNLQKLEKHLREVGLGMVNSAMSQSPVDVDVPSTGSQVSKDEGAPLWGRRVRPHSRTRSMPEGDLQKMITCAEEADRAFVPGSAREEEFLRRSARASRRAQHASQQQQQQQQQQQPQQQHHELHLPQQPVWTGESHERTGVRSNLGNALL